MPAIVKVDRKRRIVHSTFYGLVTGGELLRHRDGIHSDPDFNPEFAELADFSAATFAWDERAVSSLAALPSLFSPEVPHVVVAPADFSFEMAVRFREMTRESRPNLFVVRSLQEAFALLRDRGYAT